jgi:hypothetical protein
MAQCEKKLASGERCSNQAVPGTTYCQMHRRIVFRQDPDTGRVDTAPLPTLKDKMASSPVAKSRTKVEQQNWQACPSAAGQKPVFPGLRADERGILVAPQGVIWLQAEAADTPVSQFSRLVRLIGFLSQAFPLSGQVRVLSQTERTNYILHLTPNQSNAAQLSVFYDRASDATRLVNGRLYIGQKRAFVQYRDDGAPRGYDVSEFKVPENNNELLLVAHWGSQFLSLAGFAKTSLRDLCLHVSPLSGATDQEVPELVYALVPPPLYPLLARYFHAHHLSYRLARLQASVGELILFELSPRPDAPIGQVVPAFILDYLARLPRVVLLIQAHQSGDLSILLQWKHRYPLHLPHVAAAFAPNEMLLLVADHYPNLLIKPSPQFFDGDQLIDVHLPSTKVVSLTQLPASLPPAALKLEVVLRPDNGPTPPVAALILSAQEMIWLRQLLYLLPGEAFRDYTLYQGAELSVLIGNNRPIEGLPFGMPLRRPSNRALFIPLRSRLMPDLPWPLLQDALAVKEHVYTFLTLDCRFDLSVNLFAPLSRILMAEPHRPRVNVRMLAPSSLPVLAWTPPPEPALSTETSADKTKKSSLPARKAQTPVREPVASVPQNAKLEETALWREKARACEESQDFLAAAVCYNFLNDVTNSARCYRQAASRLRAKENEGK